MRHFTPFSPFFGFEGGRGFTDGIGSGGKGFGGSGFGGFDLTYGSGLTTIGGGGIGGRNGIFCG